MQVLDYEVADATFSTPLSSIVLVSSSPANALHLYDVRTATDRVLPLDSAPRAVAVDSTGTQAAVAEDGYVAWVDLQALAVKTTCPIYFDPLDVVLTSSGVAYVCGDDVGAHAVNPGSCTGKASGGPLYVHLALHPSQQHLFATDTSAYSTIDRCDFDPLNCQDSQAPTEAPWNGTCGDLWASADGKRLYTACGDVLDIPPAIDKPLTLEAQLEVLQGDSAYVQSLFEIPQAQRMLLIPGGNGQQSQDAWDSTVVRVHDSASLAPMGSYQLPLFAVSNGRAVMAHGLFAFATPAMDALYVVVQAGANNDLPHDFAIDTVIP